MMATQQKNRVITFGSVCKQEELDIRDIEKREKKQEEKNGKDNFFFIDSKPNQDIVLEFKINK